MIFQTHSKHMPTATTRLLHTPVYESISLPRKLRRESMPPPCREGFVIESLNRKVGVGTTDLAFAGIATLFLLGGGARAAAEEIRGDSIWGSSEAVTEPTPNLINESSTVFTWQGVTYTLYASPAPPLSAQQVLEAGIAESAPGIDLGCFYRFSAGSWADLEVAGLGDPRAAIPPSFREAGIRLRYYAPPSLDCPNVFDPGPLPLVFSADFSHPSGRRLEIRAESIETPAAEEPGTISDDGAAWKSGKRAFSVAFDGPGFGGGVVAAIARSLDPSFEEGCQRRRYELSDNEVGAHGFRLPAVPSDFELRSRKQEAKLVADCSKGASDSGSFDLEWLFTSAANVALEVRASRGVGASDSADQAMRVGDDYLRWTDQDGTTYHVYGHALDDGAGMSREELLAVARSLDASVELPLP